MKKGRFLWSAHRITEKQKVRKARNIKGNRLENSRSTVSRQHVERRSFQRDNYKTNKRFYRTLESPVFSRVLFIFVFSEIVVKSAEF